MRSQTSDSATVAEARDARAAALQQLRGGENPFALNVASVDTSDDGAGAVPGYVANQLAELLEIITQYRIGPRPTQVYPLLGGRGTGKMRGLPSPCNI